MASETVKQLSLIIQFNIKLQIHSLNQLDFKLVWLQERKYSADKS